MIAVDDLDVVLEYLEEGRFSAAKLYLINMVKAERESKVSRVYVEGDGLK